MIVLRARRKEQRRKNRQYKRIQRTLPLDKVCKPQVYDPERPGQNGKAAYGYGTKRLRGGKKGTLHSTLPPMPPNARLNAFRESAASGMLARGWAPAFMKTA